MGGSPDRDQAVADLLIGLINNHEVKLQRASRILHDNVGQVMSAVGFQLDALRYDIEQQAPELAGNIAGIQEILEQAMQHVRDLSFELHPGIVEKAGLQAALERLVGRLRSQWTVPVRLAFDASVRVPLPVADAFYKVAEVGLDNAVRHASASQIEVSVKTSAKGASIEVRDNGSGFDVDQARHRHRGLGMVLLDYYCRQKELSLLLKSTSGKGTILRVSWQAKNVAPPPVSTRSRAARPPDEISQ